MILFVKNYSANDSFYQGQTNHNYITIEFALAENSGINISLVYYSLGGVAYSSSDSESCLKATVYWIKIRL